MSNSIEEMIHQEKLKYYRNWRKKNKDKVKKYNQNFWLKKIKKETNKNDKK